MAMMLETLPRRGVTLGVLDPPSKVALLRGLTDSLPPARVRPFPRSHLPPRVPINSGVRSRTRAYPGGNQHFMVLIGPNFPLQARLWGTPEEATPRHAFGQDCDRDPQGKRWGPPGENATARSLEASPSVGYAILRLSRKTQDCSVFLSMNQHHHVRSHKWGPSGEAMGTLRGSDGDPQGKRWGPSGEAMGTLRGSDGDPQGKPV